MNIGPIMQPAILVAADPSAPAWLPHALGLLVLAAAGCSLALLWFSFRKYDR